MAADLISFNTFIYRAQHSGHPILIDRESFHAFVRHVGDMPEAAWWEFWHSYGQWNDERDLLNTQADALV